MCRPSREVFGELGLEALAEALLPRGVPPLRGGTCVWESAFCRLVIAPARVARLVAVPGPKTMPVHGLLVSVLLASALLHCPAAAVTDNCPDVELNRVHPHVQQQTAWLVSNLRTHASRALRARRLGLVAAQQLDVLEGMRGWVEDRLFTNCGKPPTCSEAYANEVARQLEFGADDSHLYLELFTTERTKTTSHAVLALRDLVQQQSTCAGTISSIMMSVCAQGQVAQLVREKLNDIHFPASNDEMSQMRAFVDYHGNERPGMESPLCAYALATLQALGAEPDADVLRRAAAIEAEVWGIELDVTEQPRASDAPAPDL